VRRYQKLLRGGAGSPAKKSSRACRAVAVSKGHRSAYALRSFGATAFDFIKGLRRRLAVEKYPPLMALIIQVKPKAAHLRHDGATFG